MKLPIISTHWGLIREELPISNELTEKRPQCRCRHCGEEMTHNDLEGLCGDCYEYLTDDANWEWVK